MKTLIVGGGDLSPDFLKEYLADHPQEYLIAADSGLDVMAAAGIYPNIVVGDYDSLSNVNIREQLREAGIPIETYPCEKDFSDTESAILLSVKKGSSEVTMLGMSGGRQDHYFANIFDLLIPLESGISAKIVDEKNEIMLKNGTFSLNRADSDKKYIGLIPLIPEIPDVKLSGFKYSGEGIRLTQKLASYGISNELIEEIGTVEFSEGLMLVIRSKD